ncbi:MAG: hypothetical protein U0531_18950 [Dehalococcoidia bacterium]
MSIMSLDWKAEQHLSHRSFHISELASDDGFIIGRTFEDCTIYGPAVILPVDHVTFENNTFEAEREALFWEIPDDREVVVGAIGLKSCVFRRCIFRGVGIAGKRTLFDLFNAPDAG